MQRPSASTSSTENLRIKILKNAYKLPELAHLKKTSNNAKVHSDPNKALSENNAHRRIRSILDPNPLTHYNSTKNRTNDNQESLLQENQFKTERHLTPYRTNRLQKSPLPNLQPVRFEHSHVINRQADSMIRDKSRNSKSPLGIRPIDKSSLTTGTTLYTQESDITSREYGEEKRVIKTIRKLKPMTNKELQSVFDQFKARITDAPKIKEFVIDEE